MKDSKPICSLSLDLDNQWSYMKTHGDAGWESFPSYLDLVVPRFLKILDDFGWKITVFVVGQDAALDKNREALQMIAAAGHEIGNHSFNHEPWLHLYSRQQVEDEIAHAEEAIEEATGQRPRGFRGPGYSLSRNVLEVLCERNYRYDASTFPTFLGPLARTYYFLKADLGDEEKTQRKQLFGGVRDGFQPINLYSWDLQGRTILEIPVTTLPIFRIPFHFSYQLYLATYSPALCRLYFRASLAICRIFRLEPSLLLHPLDFLGCADAPGLKFFPSMNLESSHKIGVVRDLLDLVARSFSVVNMSAHEQTASGRALSRRDVPPGPSEKPTDAVAG